MATFRVLKDKDNPYILINKIFIHDERLSLKAKGLMSYFLSRPDDWEFYSSEIEKNCKDGEKAIRTAITELEKAGYITRKFKKDENGKFKGGYDYTIFELPKRQNADTAKSQNCETPIRQNSVLLNKDNKLNKELLSSSSNKQLEGNNWMLFWESNFHPINPYEIGTINSYLEDGLEEDLILFALEISVENNKRNLNYVKGILNKYIDNNIKTKQQAISAREDFKRRKSNGGGTTSNNTKDNGCSEKLNITEKQYNADFTGLD